MDTNISKTNSDSNSAALIGKRKTSRNRRLKHKRLWLAAGILVIALIGVFTPLIYYTWDRQTFVPGIKIADIDVGNLTQAQAKADLDHKVSQLLNQKIVLKAAGQNSPEVTLQELGLTVSYDNVISEAYSLGRKGNIFQNFSDKRAAAKGVTFDFTFAWDDKKMSAGLDQVLAGYNKPAADASFTISPQNTMLIKPEETGAAYDSAALIAEIKALDIEKPASELKVAYQEVPPDLTAAQLGSQQITGLLASYTTYFNPAEEARSENVRLAAKALDMAVTKPGDILSFNNIVGERTVDGGYKDAYIIVNGEFVPGLAGGICQVSSTLYNTGLLANLEVAQRSNHDLAISYVPLGQDATVAYPNLDLKFKNTTGGYLLIRTTVTANSLTISLYGKVNPGQQVTISNTTESVIQPEVQTVVDNSLQPGQTYIKQQGQPGYIVKSVRTVTVNGKVVSSEALPKSVYLALPQIMAVAGGKG